MFTIDKMSRTPIYEQLIEQFESCILSGDIGADGQLPSVRALSQSLNVNPNTLQRAYAEIERRGLCYTVPGSGRYISPDALANIRSSAKGRLPELESLLTELMNRGITEEAVLNSVNKIYHNEGKVDRE